MIKALIKDLVEVRKELEGIGDYKGLDGTKILLDTLYLVERTKRPVKSWMFLAVQVWKDSLKKYTPFQKS